MTKRDAENPKFNKEEKQECRKCGGHNDGAEFGFDHCSDCHKNDAQKAEDEARYAEEEHPGTQALAAAIEDAAWAQDDREGWNI